MAATFSSVRVLSGIMAVVWVLMAFGLYRRADWMTWIWPWTDGRLTYVFLASIAAAVAAPLILVVIVDEPGAVAGIALDGFAIGIGMMVAFTAMGIARHEPRLFVFGLGTTLGAIGSGWIFLKTREIPVRWVHPLPRAVRIAFIGFIAFLVPAGTGLITGRNGFFPWVIPSATSTIIGAMFLGAASYFAYGLWRNTWVHAAGPLAGFLAYDVVLFWPYFEDYLNRNDRSQLGAYGTSVAKVDAQNLLNYLAVLVGSGAIAVFYLAINESTRIWSRTRNTSGSA